MSTREELNEVKAKRKALLEQERAMTAQLEEGKEDRKIARKAQAAARKEINVNRGALRELLSTTYEATKTGSDACNELADSLTEKVAALSSTLREFAKAAEELEEL